MERQVEDRELQYKQLVREFLSENGQLEEEIQMLQNNKRS